MKVVKILSIMIVSYVVLVVCVELTLGVFQPEDGETFVIKTTDEEGASTQRVLVQNISDDKLYAAANHWPRAWYYEALENPNVLVTIDGVTAQYVAVPVSAEEHERVDSDNANGLGLTMLFGFAPRAFLRLDPV